MRRVAQSVKYIGQKNIYLSFSFSNNRYGVKPEWLIAHRIINHRTMRDGTALYLTKWRDLSYDQSTWEEESEEVPGLKAAIEYYQVLSLSVATKHFG